MRLSLSSKSAGVLGVSGHAGCGHAHSNDGFVQDDSGGLATVLALWQEATDLSLEIRAVRPTVGCRGGFEVETVSGGIGRCSARRGITFQEARLSHYVEGMQAVRTQALAQETFGRVYGQGAMEAPVALQTAMANAAIDSFVKSYPDKFIVSPENIPGNCGLIAGTVVDFGDLPVSVMAVCNATEGGLGPNEDLEGNGFLYGKTAVMEPLKLHELPTFVIEGKVFVESMCLPLTEPTFIVRAYADDDNVVVADAYIAALEKLGYKYINPKDALKRIPGALCGLTEKVGAHLEELAHKLRFATSSREKVELVAEIIRFASQDAGGVTFMSNALHEIVGGPGSMPGTSAVMNLFLPKSYIDEHVIPTITDADVRRYVNVIKYAVPELYKNIGAATEVLKRRMHRGSLETLSV